MATRETVTEAVKTYYAALQTLRFDDVLSLVSEDIVQYCPVGEPPNRGPAGVRRFFESVAEHFEAIAVRDEFLYCIEDEAAAKWTVNGMTKSGRSVSFEGIDLFRFDESGKIREIRAYWDPELMLSAMAE